MGVTPGHVGITKPASGTEVIAGTVPVAGVASPGRFAKPNGTFEAELPPDVVTVRIDAGVEQDAAEVAAIWEQWRAFPWVTPGQHTIVATAYGGSWSAQDSITLNVVDARMRIEGVEHTQAIQFFDFEFQGSTAGADNSVPLVDQKATMLRVYVAESGNQPATIRVSGELTVGSSTFLPSNGPIRLRDDDDIDRGQFNHTLNFLLPPNKCMGAVPYVVRVFDPTRPGPRLYEDSDTGVLSFQPTPRLRIHGVLVHYTRAGFNIAAPSSTAFTIDLDTTARLGPTRQINYTGFTVIAFDGDLVTGAPTGCGPGWDDLIATLREMRTASGTTDLYVAMLPPGVPLSGVLGCGSTGVAAGPQNDVFSMMHEVGHALTRMHALCPATVQNPDPLYPSFTNPNTSRPPYPAGNIGEYGLNFVTNTVLTPQNTFDVMASGGCRPRWVSPYTFVGMRNAILATMPFSLTADAAASDESREYLHLIVRLHEGGDVELRSTFHMRGPRPAPDFGPTSSVTCDLIGVDGEILESARLHEELLQRAGGPYVQYYVTVPWDTGVRMVILSRDGEELYRQRVEEASPTVRLSAPEFLHENGEQVRIAWTGEGPDEASLRYLLRYSNDDGLTWRVVGPSQTETWHALDLDTLPGGDRCRLQVVASAVFRTTITTSEPFTVPVKPTIAEILSPVDGREIREGERLFLHGRAFSPDFGTTPSEEMLWFSNRDGLIGVGHETWTTELSSGQHEVTLRVPDGRGGESEHVVAIEVGPTADGADSDRNLSSNGLTDI